MKSLEQKTLIFTAALLIGTAFAYAVLYFNYFEAPTADFIGNIRPQVLDYLEGNFPGERLKILPVYPLMVAMAVNFAAPRGGDPVYSAAIGLNLALFIPYLMVTFFIYRRFLPSWASLGALLYLSANIYTIYTAVNSELEMALSLFIVCTMYLALRDSPLAFIPAFLGAATKWDSVFTVPAAMFRGFFIRKKRIRTLVLGAIASTGAVFWFFLSLARARGGSPYVGEIINRGPNVYRYLIDCFLTLSGIIPWMGKKSLEVNPVLMNAGIYTIMFLFGTLVLVSLVWGFAIVIRKKRDEYAPLLVFFAGFLAIHLVYQNTKARYVLPILWFLVLVMFTGFSEGVVPLIQRSRERISGVLGAAAGAFFAVISVLLLFQQVFMAVRELPSHLLLVIAVFFFILVIVILTSKLNSRILLVNTILFAGILITSSVTYGKATMDHYSLRRVEFKKAAHWYRDNYREGDRMLISDVIVPMYYTGFTMDRFYSPYFLKSETFSELIDELREKNITLVFVDDFYTKRFRYGDKNAIDRKGGLFQEVKEKSASTSRITLIKKFKTGENIQSYLYRLEPE